MTYYHPLVCIDQDEDDSFDKDPESFFPTFERLLSDRDFLIMIDLEADHDENFALINVIEHEYAELDFPRDLAFHLQKLEELSELIRKKRNLYNFSKKYISEKTYAFFNEIKDDSEKKYLKNEYVFKKNIAKKNIALDDYEYIDNNY